jgi:cystathionine beta-lyase/cystathionine gamma-synthase
MFGGGTQPLTSFAHTNPKLHVILIESLLKYRQHGTDKVNAGIVISDRRFFRDLFIQRERTGTTLADTQLAMLPVVTREMHDWRMQRIARNADVFSRELSRRLQDVTSCEVNYPMLPHHIDRSVALKYDWVGGVITARIAVGNTVPLYLEVIRCILEFAREQSIEINHGTSFGFDVSRVAIAATGGGIHTAPFLRFSIGLEPLDTIYKIARVVEQGIRVGIERGQASHQSADFVGKGL